jgi:hypothetical protein
VLVELDVVDSVEFADVVEVEAVDVAARTQGDASSAAAMAIAATAVSCAALVFILPSIARGMPSIYWISEMTP